MGADAKLAASASADRARPEQREGDRHMCTEDDYVARIKNRLMADLFGQPLMQNNLRGVWIEYMVAEALGPECRLVGGDWNAWDLELGDVRAEYPERIRIQVKNTACTQTWNQRFGRLTECEWALTLRRKPNYFAKYNPDIACEDYGFLCDVYVLCHHKEKDFSVADHHKAEQWDFYIVPVTPRHNLFRVLPPKDDRQRSKTYNVRPATLRKGHRGRSPVEPVSFAELSADAIRAACERYLD